MTPNAGLLGAFLTLALACAPEPGADSAVLESEPVATEWTVVDVQAFVDTKLAGPRPEPATVASAYLQMLGHGEWPCPPFAEPGNAWGPWATGLAGACTTPEGWTWYGQAVTGAGCMGSVVDVGALVSFEVTGPAGEVAVAGGTFQQGCTVGPEEGDCLGQLTGSFQFTEAGPGLAEGYTASLFVTEEWADGSDVVTLDGGVTWPDGTLALRSVELEAGAAAGALAVRDPGGTWFEARVPETGSGCVPLTHGGDEVGELCVDLGGWSERLGDMGLPCDVE